MTKLHLIDAKTSFLLIFCNFLYEFPGSVCITYHQRAIDKHKIIRLGAFERHVMRTYP